MNNSLLIGTADKTQPLLDITRPGFLLIDDGPIADAFLEHFRAREFDPHRDSFNPLRGMDYRRARDFAATVYTASPEGKDTLTARNGRRALTRLILEAPRLDQLPRAESDPGTAEALATVDDLLLSPVLRGALCGTRGFRLSGSVVARINRAELGDFDAFVLASLLIGQSKGQVIVPDFGFYGRLHHAGLIRQGRLTAGLNYLSELEPKLRQAVLLMENKQGQGCSFDDAVVLASYAHLVPDHTRDDNPYNRFIRACMA
jgi:hypothetical protein